MMINPRNPLSIAETAQRMADKAGKDDGKIFQKVALISMGVMAFASAAQVLLELAKRNDRNRYHDREEREGHRR